MCRNYFIYKKERNCRKALGNSYTPVGINLYVEEGEGGKWDIFRSYRFENFVIRFNLYNFFGRVLSRGYASLGTSLTYWEPVAEIKFRDYILSFHGSSMNYHEPSFADLCGIYKDEIPCSQFIADIYSLQMCELTRFDIQYEDFFRLREAAEDK